eukprot:2006712-Pyramimonas_sp.AAC.1
MPPKSLQCKLSALVPTAEELELARRTTANADKAKVASVEAGMKHYLKHNPDDKIAAPSEREAFLD